MRASISFSRDMGINRRDFFRILPTSIGDSKYHIDENRISIEPIAEKGSLTIVLGAESERRITAIMVLPRMQVDFSFSGVSQPEVDRFMKNFDIYYRRGGG
jgi:hypothetical protein